MEDYLNLFLRSVFIENLALAFFPGHVYVSRRVEDGEDGRRPGDCRDCDPDDHCPREQSHLSVPVEKRRAHLGEHLLADVDLTFLALISYIGTIAAMVQILEMALDRFFPDALQRNWASFCR